MIEIRGKAIVAETKAKLAPFREQLSGKSIAIFQFCFPVELESTSIPHTQFAAARYSTRSKEATFQACGCKVKSQTLPWELERGRFKRLLTQLAGKTDVAGTIVQNPIPPQLKSLINLIPFEQDLDGLRVGNPNFKSSATSETISRLVAQFAQPNDVIAVVGARGFVGRGVIELIDSMGLKTLALDYGDRLERTKEANVVVSATGVADLLNEEHIASHHRLVVDSGFIPQEDGTFKGDVARSAYDIPQTLTPVPGGVGPLQMATLLERLVNQTCQQPIAAWSISSSLFENKDSLGSDPEEIRQQTSNPQANSSPKEIVIPTLRQVENPKEQLKLDVAAMRSLLEQGVPPAEAISLLNLAEVSKNQRPYFYGYANYPDTLVKLTIHEMRKEVLRAHKASDETKKQNEKKRPRRSL